MRIPLWMSQSRWLRSVVLRNECEPPASLPLLPLPSRPQIAHIVRELARRGSIQPLTFVRRVSLVRRPPVYSSRWGLASTAPGQLRIQEFDLVFVDGLEGRGGLYRDLKTDVP